VLRGGPVAGTGAAGGSHRAVATSQRGGLQLTLPALATEREAARAELKGAGLDTLRAPAPRCSTGEVTSAAGRSARWVGGAPVAWRGAILSQFFTWTSLEAELVEASRAIFAGFSAAAPSGLARAPAALSALPSSSLAPAAGRPASEATQSARSRPAVHGAYTLGPSRRAHSARAGAPGR
jgi:hypothetical protein